ncbi:MAG: chitin-binding domain-containing protein [Candidatus Thiodiazotropha sp.]
MFVLLGHITDFCKTHPTALVPNGDNAAQYFKCSKLTSHTGLPYQHECPYPDLFDEKRLTCVNFMQVPVDKRPVPMAPCGLCSQKAIRS